MINEPHDPRKASGEDDEPPRVTAFHAYPPQLTDLVLSRWHEVQRASGYDVPKPAREQLEVALSVCYQASLLREEGRAVTFRVALASPDAFATSAGPPGGLHRLAFRERRPFDQHELRRLSPAAEFSRSFIGAALDGEAGPHVWGLIHSGPQWLQSVRGGRETRQAIPPVLTIAVTGPGRVLVSVGTATIAELSNGTLVGGRLDVFEAAWMHKVFSEIGDVQWRAHQRCREQAVQLWADLDRAFGPSLAEHVLRRVIASIRAEHHGGMLLVVPQRRMSQLLDDARFINVKYQFDDEEPRRRILSLTISIMNELANLDGGPRAVGWSVYENSDARIIVDLDEALFEVAHLVADLTRVDGAVILSDHLEVIGFGGEIAGNLPEVSRVARASDLEGTVREWVRTDRVGTRHRSAYRLCQEAQDVLAVVVSQDGGLRFVRWHDGAVTYWEQVATGPWEA